MSDQELDDSDHEFGITVPPLVTYLKKILRDYSDGQILKEILQNAEDAGATKVKFLYDVRQYDTQTLFRESLAPYQGPALYSYNNAKFKREDWEGIQKPARSNKEENPLKVGRFGIGFNSVYHITDLPSIISGHRIAYLDPLERHFRIHSRPQTGFRFNLQSSKDQKIFRACEDQFRPYRQIFDDVEDDFSDGQFDGTLFRFPLRQTESELCNKVYEDEEKMDDLLDAFLVDADVVMLFLRSLKEVEVMKRPAGQNSRLIVRVKANVTGHEEQDQFAEQLMEYCSRSVANREDLTMSYDVKICSEHFEESNTTRWIVYHHIAGASMSSELSHMAVEQNLLPWTAIALPVRIKEHEYERCFGRVFCFLPLPPGEESRTGLPVHLHGFFGIQSDRRAIKWPGPDQTDVPAKWNELLVKELLPSVYVRAIATAIDKEDVSVESIYCSWPDESCVHEKWNVILEPFFNKLFEERVIHSGNNGWLKIGEVVFNDLSVEDEMEVVILKCLRYANQPYASVPDFCMQSIRKYFKRDVVTTTPALLRSCIRSDESVLEVLDSREKLLILEYIMSDGEFSELTALPLLPLDDGSFIPFQEYDAKVYISTSQFHRDLIPGENQSFIRTTVSQALRDFLANVAARSRFQLEVLTLESVATLLRRSFGRRQNRTKLWKPGISNQPPTEWLEAVWNMLYKESPDSLSLFEGLPLIPLPDTNAAEVTLRPLSKTSALIVRRNREVILDEQLEDVLVKLGIGILNSTYYVIRHPSVLSQGYIQQPHADGILRATQNIDRSFLANKLQDLKDSERDLLSECIGNATINHSASNLLISLPLFKALHGSGALFSSIVSATESIGYIDISAHGSKELPQPLKLQRAVIEAEHNVKPLLDKLKIKPLSRFDVINHVTREIHEGDMYNKSEVQRVTLWLLRHWDEIKHKCESSKHVLQSLEFVPTDSSPSTMKSPPKLLDIRDQTLHKLFGKQGFFPTEPFTELEVLSALGQLGMRGQDRVTADEAVICLDYVSESNNVDLARSFLEFLAKNRSLLTYSSSRFSYTFAEHIKNKPCIPYEQVQPSFYPSQLRWYHVPSSFLSTPNETMLLSKENPMLCGSVVPLTSEDNNLLPLFRDLQMDSKKPTLQNVTVQLRECVQLTQESRDIDPIELAPMVKSIYAFLLKEWKIQRKNVIKYLSAVHAPIWNGDGFSDPSKMCMADLPFDMSPYMTQIPPAMRSFGDLFRDLGVKSTVNANVETLIDILHEVKKSCEQSRVDDTSFHARQLRLVMQILKQLHTIGEIPQDLQSRVLVPAETEGCHLISVTDSAFVDRPWLKSLVHDDQPQDGKTFTIISPLVTAELADFLHIPPLSRLLLASDDLDEFTQAGQTEPLTLRIWNILKNTYEDSAIFKEMIQNAEDAGATEVRFLIDMRTNSDAMEKLFDPGMKACQGPALWIFNDAEFTDEDFANILRLGGRTKEKNAEKIGKFGTGFNSVYHLTDVPCFVSRHFIQYFDPHTTHLGRVLGDKSQPGVRVNLTRTLQLRRFPDQFMPFNGVFGCRMSEPFHYDGSLFRLPLRSREAAQKSELSRECYDEVRLKELVLNMWKSSRNLVIFTRKVMKVSMYHLSAESTDATKAVKLFGIEKHCLRNTVKDGIMLGTESITQEMTQSGAEFFHHGTVKEKSTFKSIKATCEGSATARKMATQESEAGLSPRGEVSVTLLEPYPSKIQGEVYCYLPLSIKSMLPVHINGTFAVTENRQHLYKSTPAGMNRHAEWNHLLLREVVCRAYIYLLSDENFVEVFKGKYGSVAYDCLWPDVDNVPKDGDCSEIFDAFYHALVHGFNESQQPALFWKDEKALRFQDVVFLSQEFQDEGSIKAEVVFIMETCLHNSTVVEVSDKTRRAFVRADLERELKEKTFDEERFFDEVFLPRLPNVSDENRNALILFALNCRKNSLRRKLTNIRCIPVSGGDIYLQTPKDLVHPKRKAAKLFSEADGVFPSKDFSSNQTFAALVDLGMMTDYVSAEKFLAQCISVASLCAAEDENASRRSRDLMTYLSEMLCKPEWRYNQTLKQQMMTKAILPVVQDGSTKAPFLPWKSFDPYMAANSIYCTSQKSLVSSVAPVLDESNVSTMPYAVSRFLGLLERRPSLQEVMNQLRNIRNHFEEGNVSREVEICCNDIYKYLSDECRDNPHEELIASLRDDRWILIGKRFVHPSKVAIRVYNFLEPCLFQLPRQLTRYTSLVQTAEIKETFQAADYEKALQDIYLRSDGKPLQAAEVTVVITLARLLEKARDQDDISGTYLPDVLNIMRPTTDLCYSDVDWISDEDGKIYQCHQDISIFLARRLKVKDVRHQVLEQYAQNLPGEAFGQHEKLTFRIKRILQSYSGEDTVLKELLQNADDAGATEIHVVYDPRSHPDQRIFGDNMKPLQGPALCVFNNQSFSAEDFRGIQDLGQGSKGNEMNKIGRYGVGFNTVYRLSDCPSFISGGDILCVFDPLCNHIPGATDISPGRLYNITDRMRKTYSDVFPCYLEDKLTETHDHYTVFRLPLRREASAISGEIWDEKRIKKLLKGFEESASESLLFLKNVKFVKISQITEEGVLTFTRTVQVEIEPAEEEKKKGFYTRVSEYIAAANNGEGVKELQPADVCYEIFLRRKGQRNREHWVICQQLGCCNWNEMDENFILQYKLIPVGGVAALLSGKELKGKAFCFLPLPIDTKLPVHIHGYFALDHESRRSLWRGDTQDRQTLWNQVLFEHVISLSYIKVLSWIRNFFTDRHEWSLPIPQERLKDTIKRLDAYHDFFPYQVGDRYWNDLISIIYEVIACERHMLFPVLLPNDDKTWLLTWRTPVVSGPNTNESELGFCNRLSETFIEPLCFGFRPSLPKKRDVLKTLLLQIGFPVIESPLSVVKKVMQPSKKRKEHETSLTVLQVTPSNVVNFLRGKNRLSPQLPIPISQSKLKDSEGLALLLKYCKTLEKLALDGLPLLLTQDGILRMFSPSARVFNSKYACLFPKNSSNFLHMEFFDTFLAIQDPVFKDLDIAAIAEMTSTNFPFLKVPSDDYLPFGDKCIRLTPQWFKDLWNLLEHLHMSSDGPNVLLNLIKAKLGDFAILPAVQLSSPTQTFSTRISSLRLVPLKLSFTVLAPQRDVSLPASSTLQTLGIYKIADHTMPLINRLSCNIGSRTQILEVLGYWVYKDISRFKSLSKTQHEELLEAFLGSAEYLQGMKRLPCFETISGEHVTIENSRSVFVVPETIPSRDQHAWIDRCPAVFLKPKAKFAHLYETLGLSKENEYNFYVKFILPNFRSISQEGRITHLLRIKHMLLVHKERKAEISHFVSFLRSLPFILGRDGILHTASHFFDPEVEVFRLMKARDDFPPSMMRQRLGLHFLREIGLTTEVTKQMFLTFVKEIEGGTDEIDKKSKCLVSCLKNECSLHSDRQFLQQVGRVRFLIRRELEKELKSLHLPVADEHICIMYSGSTIEKTKLVWTVLPMLPQYAAIKSKCQKCDMQDIQSELGMIRKPELSVVLKHTTLLCRRLKEKGQRINHHARVSEVLEEILSFLCDQCTKNKSCTLQEKCEHCGVIEDELGRGNVPLIPVDDSSCALVEATQMSRTVPCNRSPYLYQLPDRWGPFFWLLRILGTTDKPSIAQNAFVLRRVFEIGKLGTNHPNILRMVKDVSCDLYRGIQKSDGPSSVQKDLEGTSDLYLPSTKHGLQRSDTLFFNDANHLKGRILTCDIPILDACNEEEYVIRQVLGKLPERLRPKVLSGRVKEVLNVADIDQAKCPEGQHGSCDFERQLAEVLKSEDLLTAVASIVKHNGNKVVNEDITESMRNSLMHLEVICMQGVVSVLQLDEINIADSAKQIPAFVKDENQLYVTHTTEENKIRTLTSVAIRVNHVLGNLIQDKGLLVLVDLLSLKSPSNILPILSEHNVDVIHGACDNSDTCLPPPGSSIPRQIFHLIEQDMWVSFEEGEYVAQQMDGNEERYVYARIIRRLRGESIQAVYLVDVGSDIHLEASVFDIHKIHIPKAQTYFELVPSARAEPDYQETCHLRKDPSFSANIDEARRLVTTELKEIWNLPEEERRKALHRLMLKWHPDKHPEGPNLLFNEAFKHLQRELDRFTKGVSIYDDIAQRASQRASDDRQRFNTYGGYAGGSWRKGSESTNWQHFFEEHSRAPDLPNARRWLRQAYEDLRSGRNDMDPENNEPFFEWVSFKCHQAVEKGLKAAQLASRGDYSFSHTLRSLVYEVKDKVPNGSLLFDKVQRLSGLVDYFKSRYPDNYAFPKIPHDVYSSRQDAQTALNVTEEILNMIASYVKQDSQRH